jgi:polyisoprenoid-binding protein YceI
MPTNLSPRKARLAWGALLAMMLGATLTARGQELPLDPGKSSVTFLGEAFLHNFRGEAKDISGHASLDPNANPPIQRATLRFRIAALTTFHEGRDQKMRAWLQVATVPDATFRLESVRLVSGDNQQASAERPARFRVEGSFTFHGVTKRISGNAEGWRANGRVYVSGEIVIDTLSFGLPQIREMLMTVGTNVKVTYRFAFVLP